MLGATDTDCPCCTYRVGNLHVLLSPGMLFHMVVSFMLFNMGHDQ